MDNTAIQQIQETAGITDLITQLAGKKTAYPTVIVPENYRVSDLEKYMPERSSYRVEYSTISGQAFIDYCIDHSDGSEECFVDTERMQANTYFDIGTKENPLHQRHTARITAKVTAAYKALIIASTNQLSQRSASEFIEDWGNSIRIYDESGNEMKPVDAARSLRNITIERMKNRRSEVGDFSSNVDVMEKVEAKSANMPLPSKILFETEPYIDFEARTFTLAVSINVDERRDGIGIKFRYVKQELIQEEMGEEFLDAISNSLKGIKCYIGAI